jgi:hypothetical protein
MIKSENENNIMRNYHLNIYDIKNNSIIKKDLDLEEEETTTQTQKNNSQKNAKVKNKEKEKEVEIDEKGKGKIEIENTNIKEIKNKEEDNKKNNIYDKINVNNNKRKNNEIFFPEKINNNYSRGTNKNYIHNQINLNGINNNYFYYLQSQYIHLQHTLDKINKEKSEFEKMKILGMCTISNPQNKNNYLYNQIHNNYTNSDLSQNNPLNPFINRVNFNFNYYGFQNPFATNYLQNQNIMNMNYLSNMYNYGNSKKYTITFKSKTNIPNVEKVSKIKIITSFHKKDNSKIKQENNANIQSKKEKSIKNIININDIISGKETRTVVRLNPIPPSYSSFDISKLLDKYLQIEPSKNNRIYKAIYVPLCKVIGKNLGYCFVMMVQPKYVIDFYKVFFRKVLGEKKCNKPCNVIWADFQGDIFLKQNEDDPLRKPLIFKDVIKDSSE